MDYQNYADGFFATACVLSVEKEGDEYGDIRIVAGNDKFIAMVEQPSYVIGNNGSVNKFEPGSIYYKYLPRTPDFEDKCYKAAILKKPTHTYIHISTVDIWFNMFFLPVDHQDGDKFYCVYLTEPCDIDDIDTSASSSSSVAEDVLKTCIKLRGNGTFGEKIKGVIADLRKLCGAEVCSVILVNKEKGLSKILASDKAENSTIKTLSQSVNMFDVVMSWEEMIGERDSIIVKSEKDLEYAKEVNYPWYQTLVESDVKSIVIFPLRNNKELLGFIWTTNFDVKHTLRIKEMLELSTFFISSEIANYMMFERIKNISFTDMLTGINNRNAMNNKVSEIISGEYVFNKPYGIVFADLNGLKRVNDEIGHSAGDLLLKKAGLTLQEVFVEDEAYRAGGDEFMVIAEGYSKEEFDKKVNELRKKASDPENVCFSVGSVYNDTGMDIRDVMSLADELMYKDKEKYYIEHPERKYR